MRPRLWAAASGVVAAGTVLATAELIALFAGSESSPLFAVGSLVIDLAPPGVKDTVIQLFGTGDKAVLLILLGVVVLVLAGLVGILELRRPPFGTALLVVVSGVAVLAVSTRSGAGAFSAVPTVIGMIVGVLVLRMLVGRLRRWQTSEQADTPLRAQAGVDRRAFLVRGGISAVAALVVGSVARTMNAAATAVSTAREAILLPPPTTPAPAIPAGAELGLDGLAPYLTPNDSFYRIDTALQVPQVEAASWSVKVTGMVEQEIELSWDELLALPLEEHAVTLACVSNEVGGELIGNAVWLGYPIRELLARAKPTAGADMVLSRSTDGFTAGTPLEALQDADRVGILAVGMNGEPLPVEHGYPVRMVVAGLYGYVSATKWVVELNVTRFADAEGYWTPRGWSALGPIKTESRIDVPRGGASVSAGTVPVAGVAWAQHTGIEKVEVRIDDGDWAEARLADTAGIDTWVQWVYEWQAQPGSHTVAVRATDRSGYTQTSDEAPPAPDGATGWDSVSVSVS
ncbi:molybdopterin-dependent oxidoreductase [Herbiconiux ginsengi]|uniref:DMSO/TMAO reductase YedYZ, molybdopterin-dependent catalytic subunit n=1 Tax=Herbiconiux ginsengi TaxID=381665 RepID=A0A1H3MLZ2_9MICO|nr:molybdopterin-dependent oxidoreductase [Herbiconiux ginsengi]SDY77089.1 DMSO/TMAO reductase YedYZ, molybdopterin-dependent catalytic subunit [Herbiconiux ginsengi]